MTFDNIDKQANTSFLLFYLHFVHQRNKKENYLTKKREVAAP